MKNHRTSTKGKFIVSCFLKVETKFLTEAFKQSHIIVIMMHSASFVSKLSLKSMQKPSEAIKLHTFIHRKMIVAKEETRIFTQIEIFIFFLFLQHFNTKSLLGTFPTMASPVCEFVKTKAIIKRNATMCEHFSLFPTVRSVGMEQWIQLV